MWSFEGSVSQGLSRHRLQSSPLPYKHLWTVLINHFEDHASIVDINSRIRYNGGFTTDLGFMPYFFGHSTPLFLWTSNLDFRSFFTSVIDCTVRQKNCNILKSRFKARTSVCSCPILWSVTTIDRLILALSWRYSSLFAFRDLCLTSLSPSIKSLKWYTDRILSSTWTHLWIQINYLCCTGPLEVWRLLGHFKVIPFLFGWKPVNNLALSWAGPAHYLLKA